MAITDGVNLESIPFAEEGIALAQKGVAYELDKNKMYLILVDSAANSERDMRRLSEVLHRFGYNAVVGGLRSVEKIQIIATDKLDTSHVEFI